jgi:peptidoglycan/LPS O-acetylase OafA/YrhL
MLPITTTDTSFGYQPALDGLRGVFVIAVLLFHGGFLWAGGGFLGVSGFFTLSGFLICALLVDERARSGTIDLRRFWVRRARRLLPAAWLALAGAVLYGATVASPAVQRDLQGDVLAALAYVANWRFITSGTSYQDLFSEPSPVTHLWSLAIEEQYYLVFPLMVMGLLALGSGRRVVLGVTLAGLGVVSTLWMATLFDPAVDTARVYYGTDTRVAEFLVGAVAGLVWRRWRLDVPARPSGLAGQRALQVGAVLAALVLLAAWSQAEVSTSLLYRGGFAVHAVLVSVVLLAAVRPGPVRSAMAFEPLRRLGLISYGVYLYHWPIFLWLTSGRTGLDGVALFAVRVAVTLAVSIASFVLIERPIRQGVVLRGRTGVVVAPLAVVVVMGGAMLVPTPAVPVAGAIGEEIDLYSEIEEVREPSPESDESPGSAPAVSVFGDSTAVGIFRGLLLEDRTSGTLDVRRGHMRLGCGLMHVDAMRSQGVVYDLVEWCAGMRPAWNRVVGSAEPDIAVVLFGPWDVSDVMVPGATEWAAMGDAAVEEFARSELRQALEVLTRRVELVVWLTSPPIDQGRNQIPRGPIDPSSDPARMERWNQLIAEVAAEFPPDRVVIVDLDGWFQTLPGGPFDSTVRPDGVHLADDQVQEVGMWLAAELIELWGTRPRG